MKLLVEGRPLVQKHVSGVQRYTADLLEAMRALNAEFDVLIPQSRSRMKMQLWEHFVLPREALRADVLFCPGNVAPVRLSRSVRLVVTLHCLRFLRFPETYHPMFRLYYRRLIPKVLHRADAVLTVSQAAADEIATIYPQAAAKLRVTPLGVSGHFQPDPQHPREKRILYVGSLAPGKNIGNIIEAFSQVAEDMPHELCIVGSPSPAMRSLGKASNAAKRLGQRVRWTGQVTDRKELVDIYRSAQMLAFPSQYESFGLPVLEAMACGTPVVASDIPALRETAGTAAEFVAADDVDALAERFRTLAADEGRREAMSAAGLERAKEFSWQRCAERTLAAIAAVGGSE
ncbi:MAG: glycosyltransferase family 4 protein [Phycisphaerae bacterium]